MADKSTRKKSKKVNSNNVSLYKYTKLEYINEVLSYGIYASTLEQSNDPFEYYDIDENIRRYFRICCLTRSYLAKLMWSHYGDSHKGCLIHIEKPKNFGEDDCTIKLIEYSAKRNFPKTAEALEQALYTKDKKWLYEKEARAVYSGTDDGIWTHANVDGKDKVFLKVKITQIIFGAAAEGLKEKYEKALNEIKQYNDKMKNKKDKIEVKKLKLSKDRFALEYDKDFDYEKELEKTNTAADKVALNK